MALKAARTPVTAAAAVLLADNPRAGSAFGDESIVRVTLKNATATAVVYLDGANTVSSASGFAWDPVADGPLLEGLAVEPGEELWARLATGDPDQSVQALRGGR